MDGAARSVQELRWVIRARRLLAAAVDDHRAIAGPVSAAWLLAEAERQIPWERLPPVLQERFLPPTGAPPRAIPSNWLPKLEPSLNAHVLAGVILMGPRMFGSEVVDLVRVVAAMIHGTFGLRDRASAFLPAHYRTVDEAYLREEFGEEVLDGVLALREQLALFDAGGSLSLAPADACVLAAVKAAQLRLTARAAGDAIFSTLSDAQRDELSDRGIDPADERPHLERDHQAARAALELPGVDPAIRGPVGDVLLRSVEHVLIHGTPARELVGRYGSAIHNFHCALPVWEHYSPIVRRTARTGGGEIVEVSGPFALPTLFVTSLEVTRYLHNVRRKGGRTGAGHSFLVSSRVERLLGTHVTVPLVAGSDCHDVVEDGGYTVAGYDQDLELFAGRFGGPLAALVAEVTDSFTKEDGPAKAATTVLHPLLRPMEAVYNLGQLAELRARATDPEVPFTLEGILLKVADFGVTQEEGLHCPDLMRGVWAHTGARMTWDLWSKGRIVQPLLARLRLEVRTGGDLPPTLRECLRWVLVWSFDTADLYLVQNLAILAGEYRLERAERDALFRGFLEDGAPLDLDLWLDEARLDPEVRRRGLSATHRLVPGGPPLRDLGRLHRYAESAAWRRQVRRELALPPLPAEQVTEVLARLGRG